MRITEGFTNKNLRYLGLSLKKILQQQKKPMVLDAS